MSRVDDHWRVPVIDPGHRSVSYLLFSAVCELFFPLRLPKAIKARRFASCESKFFLHCFWKWKSQWNSRYSVLTDFLPVSKHSIQHGAQVFYPLNDWIFKFYLFIFYFFTSKQREISGFEVKPLHPCCVLVQRAVYLNLGETISVENYIYCLYSFIIHKCLISH